MTKAASPTRIGVEVWTYDYGPDIRWIARQVEAAGLESMFLYEHTHVPLDRSSAHPGGEELVSSNARALEPFIGATAAASVTSMLKIGTGICLIAQHDPIILGKQISTIDLISGGRFLFGIGAGWNREEMANHGVDPDARFEIMREHVEAMKHIWTNEVAAYNGTYVQFGPMQQFPKPVQSPHPPVLVGGEGPTVLDRVLHYGDGWIPNDHDELLARRSELNRRAAEQGRSTPIPVTAYAMPWDRARIDRYLADGVERLVFNLPAATEQEVTDSLQRLKVLLPEFLG